MTTQSPQGTDVVITGLGVFSSIGIGMDAVWESLAASRTGITTTEFFKGFAAPDGAGAEVRGFTEEAARKLYLKELRKSIKVMCRDIQLGVAGALQAIEHSGLKPEETDHERLGVEFGANLMLTAPDVLYTAAVSVADPATRGFEFDRWGQEGMPKLEPLWLLKYLPNMPACHIGIVADARGPNNSLTMDDASGGMAIGEALRILQRNAADVMITGTTGTTMHPIKSLHLALWPDWLAKSPAEPHLRSRPFDRDRTGWVVGEGAASFILERGEHARKRGAKIFGRVLGTGSSCVVGKDGQPRYREAIANALKNALRNSGLNPTDVGHINAHGLGAPDADIAESQAIHDVFGDYASKIPVTAPKSFLGNSGSSSGTVELAMSLIALQHGVIPATLNYEHADPQCAPLEIVTGSPRATKNKVFLCVNVTRKGQAAVTAIEAA